MTHKNLMWMAIVVFIIGIIATICNTIVSIQQPNISNITAEFALIAMELNTALDIYLEHHRNKDIIVEELNKWMSDHK